MRFPVKVKPDWKHVNQSIGESSFDGRMHQILSDVKPEEHL